MPESAFTWDQRPPTTPRPQRVGAPGSTAEPSSLGNRITLREAEHRFGVPVGTLRGWARRKAVDAVMADGPSGRQWMVTPESIAHRLSHAAPPTPTSRSVSTGPTTDGTAMLVPRDAWDRLMDQLGNLHEAGLRLAEARERAAKAETEATFLRERLGEIRSERDQLKARLEASNPPMNPASATPPVSIPVSHPSTWEMLKRWWRR
jgi:hypothetical protein